MLAALLVAQEVTGGGLPAETFVGFGVAAPVVAVLWALLIQANRARDAAQAAHLADLRLVIPAIEQATAAHTASTEAMNALADEYRADLRDRRSHP